MLTVEGFKQKLQGLNIALISMQSIETTKGQYNDQNNLQLYDGKTKTGLDIHPNYLEDPFFKTQAQAIGYAKWKAKITPNAYRNFYSPNLYINGFYHSTRSVTITETAIVFNSEAPFAGSIEEKYGPSIDGIGGKYLRLYLKIDLVPEFFKRIRNEIKQ